VLEWIKVLYPRTRDVYVEGVLCGVTNKVLAVAPGRQRVDLGTPLDYTPSRRTVTVSGTSPSRPCEITFTPLP
jgi:hypothetical protein